MGYLKQKKMRLIVTTSFKLRCDLPLGLKRNYSYDGRWEIWNKTLANAAIPAREEVSSVGRSSSNGHQAVGIAARKYRILRESIWDGTVIVGR